MKTFTFPQKALHSISAIVIVFGMLFGLPRQPAAQAQRSTVRSAEDPSKGLSVLRSDENGLLLELVIPEYQVDALEIDGASYDLLHIDGATLTSEPGMPQLPKFDALIGVPPLADIQVLVRSADAAPLPGRFRLPPSPQPAPLQGEFQPGAVAYDPADIEYDDLAVYPMSSARVGDDAWLRDRRIARLELFPFQYLPAQGQLNFSQRLLVEVIFEMPLESGTPGDLFQTDRPQIQSAGSDLFGDQLAGSLLNSDAASRWRGIPRHAVQENSAITGLAAVASPAYRIPINEDGLYKLSYEVLQDAGLDVGSLNPHNLHLTSQGLDVAAYLAGDGDTSFEPGEYLAFYGQKFYGNRLAELYQAEDDHWLTFVSQETSGAFSTWTPQMNAVFLEQYTQENVYWLSVEAAPGLRMQTVPGEPVGGTPLAQTYRETVRAEQSVYFESNQSWTLFSSEDNWLWERQTANAAHPTGIYTYTMDLTGVASGLYSATVRGEAVAVASIDTASPDHHTTVYLNDSARTQPVDDKLWDGKSRYRFEAQVDQTRLVEGSNVLNFVIDKTPVMTSDVIYFDWFEVEFEREFIADEGEITFTPSNSGTYRYQIDGFPASDVMVLDITHPFTPTAVTGVLVNSSNGNFNLDFNLTHNLDACYYAGQLSNVPASQITYYAPPDLDQEAGYLVITHRDFLVPSQRLADYRQGQDLSVRVIDIQDLYNQFNYGIFSPLAVKNFLKHTFTQWANPPQYAVLVGDGSWNMVGSPRYNNPTVYMPPNLAWVDPWGGIVDSASLLAAVVGEDIMPDLHISRIPVNSAAELDAVVDKVIAYETAPRQDWQRSLMFVADNIPDSAGDFIQFSNGIIADYIRPGFTAQQLYENDYGCLPGVSSCPAINHAITTTLNSTSPAVGALVMNYVGHGAIHSWASEDIWKRDDLPWLTNTGKLPVVLSMTCLDAYWIHPGVDPTPQESLMELMLRMDQSGMVASFSPTGWGVTTGHDELHRGFFEALFDQGIWLLGAAAQQAKIRLFATGNNYDLINTFTIFGDPALHIASPYSLVLSPVVNSDSGPPGSTVDYTFQVTNTGAITDTIAFQVTGNAWQVDLPPETILPEGGTTAVTLTVTIPAGAADAQSDSFTLWAVSKSDTGRKSQAQVTTTAYEYGVKIFSDSVTKDARTGDLVTYALELLNNGAYEDSFDVKLSGNSWNTTIEPALPTDELQPGDTVRLLLEVIVPHDAALGDSDAVLVTAFSMTKPSRSDDITLTTRLPLHKLFLPEIEK